MKLIILTCICLIIIGCSDDSNSCKEADAGVDAAVEVDADLNCKDFQHIYAGACC